MSRTKILKMAEAVRFDLQKAIANYEVFVPTARDGTLIARVNTNAAGAPAFNVISDALHLAVIGTLCRMWDKCADAAHIPNLARDLSRERSLAGDQKGLGQWIEKVRRLETWEPLVTLRNYRNVGLSHTSDPNRPDPRSLQRPRGRRVVHGDERLVLEETISVMHEFDSLLGVAADRETAKEWSRPEWKRRAAAFWDDVGGGK